ncbi:MAG TPA: carbohydrate kinase family protein [Roseiflexaceae bacterium]|nr:carbohydrate kinase family protein [Roseiflexaceae bacterium]HMP42069.1 carbohydrate kinase family protein [Roseiflexaceae bacterium]
MQPLYLIYGKLIVDNIRLRSGEMTPGTLGGGGPQAAFGARLYADHVALLTRSGIDLEPIHEQTLQRLGLDLSGWMRHADLPTPRGLLEYDADERLQGHGIQISRPEWFALLARPIELPPHHRTAAAIHLVTEFGNEPMGATALELGSHGALVSLEPIFEDHSCTDPAGLLDFCRTVEIVTPDWPAATACAGSDDIATVVRFWANLGPRAVAFRRGSRGAIVWDRDSGKAWSIPPLPVEVVDPTGAGNAFGGGWCVGWHQHHDARIAGCMASVAAALMITHSGMPPLTETLYQQATDLLTIALERATLLEL